MAQKSQREKLPPGLGTCGFFYTFDTKNRKCPALDISKRVQWASQLILYHIIIDIIQLIFQYYPMCAFNYAFIHCCLIIYYLIYLILTGYSPESEQFTINFSSQFNFNFQLTFIFIIKGFNFIIKGFKYIQLFSPILKCISLYIYSSFLTAWQIFRHLYNRQQNAFKLNLFFSFF